MPSEPKENDVPQPDTPETEETVKKNIGEGKTVVLVEDDPTTSVLVRDILKDHGFEVIEAVHGKDAWVKLRPDLKPCLFICDVIMPEMDGFKLFKRLRENAETAKLPVLITSSRKAMADTFLAMGADGFMPKPLDTPKFLKTVHVLSLRGQEIIDQQASGDKPSGDKTKV